MGERSSAWTSRLIRDWLFWLGIALFGYLVFVMATTLQAKGGGTLGVDDLLFVVAFPAALTALFVVATAGIRSAFRKARAARH